MSTLAPSVFIGSIRPEFGPDRIDGGPLTDLPRGRGQCFRLAGRRIAVFRQEDGRIFATEDACPHKGGPLSEGILKEGRVICPLHARSYDLVTGGCPDSRKMLTTYPVRVVDGRVIVSLPRHED